MTKCLRPFGPTEKFTFYSAAAAALSISFGPSRMAYSTMRGSPLTQGLFNSTECHPIWKEAPRLDIHTHSFKIGLKCGHRAAPATPSAAPVAAALVVVSLVNESELGSPNCTSLGISATLLRAAMDSNNMRNTLDVASPTSK